MSIDGSTEDERDWAFISSRMRKFLVDPGGLFDISALLLAAPLKGRLKSSDDLRPVAFALRDQCVCLDWLIYCSV